MTRILCHYKNLVKQFLETFSSKLKPREFLIWKKKLAKTCDDVQAVLRKGKNTKPQLVKKVKVYQPSQKCNCCPVMSNHVVRLNSVLVMFYAFLHLVQADQTQTKAYFGKPEFHEARAKEINGDEIVTVAEIDKTIKADNSFEEFDSEDEEISEAPAADKVVAKNDATVLVDKSESSDSDDDPDDAAASIVNMLNCEKTSDGCYAISKDEQFRRSAMAFYKQPKSLGSQPF